jgi:hypothetical protein
VSLRMRRNGGGVQLFGLVGVCWKPDHGCAAIAGLSSGYTGGVTAAMCIAHLSAGRRGAVGQHAVLVGGIVRAMRAVRTIVITSEQHGPDDVGGIAWGIMVPKRQLAEHR